MSILTSGFFYFSTICFNLSTIKAIKMTDGVRNDQ
jgi:hypothetical protein